MAMAEHTSVGRFLKSEFWQIGLSLFDSEDLITALYEVFLSLLAEDGWVASNFARDFWWSSIEDVATAYLTGFYIPCTPRLVLGGQVDLKNDVLPAEAGLLLPKHQGADPQLVVGPYQFATVKREAKLPRGIAPIVNGGVHYSLFMMWEQVCSRRERNMLGEKSKRFYKEFVTVSKDGRVLPCPIEGCARRYRPESVFKVCGTLCNIAAAAINATSDARYLWMVETSETVVGKGCIRTPLRLGVSPEHVKSLFYARSLPVTESGRKRPILHWVRAHLRRLEAGIDIDVRRHLRGIDRFDMGGLPFEITSPCKGRQQEAA
jgi:hypothetical protein